MFEFLVIYHTDASYRVDFKISVQRYRRHGDWLGDLHPFPYLVQARTCIFVKIAFFFAPYLKYHIK